MSNFLPFKRDTLAIELLRTVCAGTEVRRGDATLKMLGAFYVMSKDGAATHLHTLAVACTDPQRLLAHWEGFSGGSLS